MRPLAQGNRRNGNRRNGNRRSGGRRLGRLFLFEPLEERKVLSASTGETASILASFNISTLASGRSLEIPTTSFVLPAELGTAVEESLPILGIPQMRLDPRFAGIDGTGTTVVIIDTGIDLNHPFFGPDSNNDGVADRIVYQYDFGGINGIPDSSANNSDTPETLGNTHGTHVSSIVASQDPNYPGVAPGVGIIHLKIFDDFGSATFGRLEQALQWVVQNAEAYNIVSVNMSVADGQTHEVPLVGQAAAIYGLSDELAALHDLGVVSVGAAGNRYLGVEGLAYPAADPKVISVGATHDVVLEEGFFFLFSLTRFGAPCIDCIAAFSQRHVNMLDVFAPGSPITAAQIVEMGDLTVAQHGTSQAAPMIAGMTALAQQLSLQVLGRKLGVEEFRGLLRNSSAIINDGDDEVDSVFNTGHNFRRADMQGLAAAIVELRDPQPVASGAVFANEGTPYSLVLSATQQGDGEIIEWTVDWGDGTVDVVDGSTTSLSHVFADGPEDYTVIATATDQYGSYAAPAVSVHVSNVAPELSISGAPFVLTGASYALSLFSVDIGSDAIASWNIAWGDGTVDEVVGNPATVHHTYQVPGMYEIVASATDEDGSYSANPKTVLAAPVQIAGGTSAQEGVAYFLNLLSSPLLSEPVTEWLIDWGDGSDPEIVAAGVGSVSHVFADGPLNHTIHATATLDTLSYAANLVQVAVQNVSPTLTLSGPSTVMAGIAYPLSLGAVDPGNDTIAGWIVHWGDGTTEPWPGGSEVSATHVYAEPGDYQIVATAIDEDGTYDASTILVNVSYVQIAGTASVQEGSAYGLELLSSAFLSEPLTQWEIDWGDGLGPEIVTGNVGSASRVFADGPSNRTVRASAFDGTTTYFSNELLVEVHNVAPTITLDGPAVVNEGDVFTLELAVTDPGADTVSSWTINWGDGMTQVIEGNPSSVEHVYADDAANPYLILATATDEDGSYDALPFSVTVTNVAATVAIIGGTVVDEGSVYVLNFAATDPGDDTVSEWVIHWGDGSVDTILSQLLSLEHLYVDGADTHTVYAVATDEDGSFTSNEIEVTVRDVAPTLLISGASDFVEGLAYTMYLSATDPGDDTLAYWDVLWGDEEVGEDPERISGNVTSVSHVYSSFAAATYVIRATATNEDGTTDANTLLIESAEIGISGPAFVDEGSEYVLSLYSSAVVSPTIVGWEINWGDETTEVIVGNPASVFHDYLDGTSQYQIVATATNGVDDIVAAPYAVTVRNVTPTLILDGPAVVNEGDVFTLELAVTDPGADTVISWTIDWGDETIEEIVGNPSSVTHVYTDEAANPYLILATATDTDGSYDALPFSVTVSNVVPTVFIVGDTVVDEGSAYVLNLAATDPGDDTVSGWTIVWGDGTTQMIEGNPSSVEHDYVDDAPNPYLILATVTDEDGSYDALPFSVTVTNVAPTVSVSGNTEVEEGAVYLLNLAVADPGDDTVSGWTIDWGDGTIQVIEGNPSLVEHVYADDAPNPYFVLATVTDEDGSYEALPFSVTVANVAVTVSISGNTEVEEGSVFVLNLAVADPGDDTVSGWTIHWGDGTTQVIEGNPDNVSHVYADGDHQYEIIATVRDEDGENSSSVFVNVQNVAPTLTLDGPAVVNEGDVFTLELAFIDPGADTVSSWTVNWGDGMTQLIEGNPSSVTHVYVDGATNPYLILATATDEDGSYDALPFSVTVANVAPTASIVGDTVVDEGSVYVLHLAATDPGADTVSRWTVHWGDGSVESILGQPSSLVHFYADGLATHTVYAVVTDEDGSFTSNEIEVTVLDVAPTLLISGASVFVEELAYTLYLSATDPGDDTLAYWDVLWGDEEVGEDAERISGNVTSVSHVYSSFAAATYVIRAAATNEDGTTDANTLSIESAEIGISGPAFVDEGSEYVLSFYSSAVVSPTIVGWEINWGDGSDPSMVSGNPASVSHVYSDGTSHHQVLATATNGVDDFEAAPYAVTVRNLAPTVSAVGLPSVTEGSEYTLEFASSDPGEDAILRWEIDWGDGGAVEVVSGSATSADHHYVVPGDYEITVSATDEDGTYFASPIAVQVLIRSVPLLLASGPTVVDEGSPYTLEMSASNLQGEILNGWTIQWGDGETSVLPGDATVAIHSYADGPIEYVVRVSATVGGEILSANDTQVRVENVAPLLTVTGASMTLEGAVYSINWMSSDPGMDTIDQWTIDWGDGVIDVVSGAATSANHVYIDGPQSVSITVTASDEDGIYMAAPLAVTVNDVQPTLTLGGIRSTRSGFVYNLPLLAAEVGTDEIVNWTIDWGDGSVQVVQGHPPSVAHTYSLTGPQEVVITATATNEDGIFSAEATTVFIHRHALFSDLNGDVSVDGADLGHLYGNWNRYGIGDVTLDGLVDGADLGLLFSQFTGDTDGLAGTGWSFIGQVSPLEHSLVEVPSTMPNDGDLDDDWLAVIAADVVRSNQKLGSRP